ncbi:MAG: cation acetate symporter [Phycisphaeraceae bacterium]
MLYEASSTTVIVFGMFVAVVLSLSFYLGRKAKSAKGYYAAHGGVHWFVNGVAFAGDYLSAASFLGICGMIAFNGYDGFLYSIGFLAGWIVALFVIAEPIKRLGKFTFADALDSKFNSRGIKMAAAIATLVVSIFYLIPQMSGAGALVTPLLGFPHAVGVIIVGVVVVLIVVTAGMVSTTWVQFIKGSLLVVFCALLTIAILSRGLTTEPQVDGKAVRKMPILPAAEAIGQGKVVEENEAWKGKPYVRIDTGSSVEIWRKMDKEGTILGQAQYLSKVTIDGVTTVYANGRKQGRGEGEGDLLPVGYLHKLPDDAKETGPLGPLEYFKVLQDSEAVLWRSETIKESDKTETTVYYPRIVKGEDILSPGSHPTFAGVRSDDFFKKLDFLSLMLALFCGTASLPHILIRYYTVKDQAAARKSTVVGIAAIGFFYVLTLYLGLGAMTSGTLDPTSSNMSAPLLAKSFGVLPFAIISAIAFTTVLGTVSGLIMAASGAVAHDIMENVMKIKFTDEAKVRAGKSVAVVVGVIAIFLGIAFEKLNVGFLVGWAFNIAASANLPAIIMLLFWKGTTKQGITWSIIVGMVSSLGWILLSAQAFKDVYGLPPENAIVPFSQPGIVTIPLAFMTLVVVSWMTKKKEA